MPWAKLLDQKTKTGRIQHWSKTMCLYDSEFNHLFDLLFDTLGQYLMRKVTFPSSHGFLDFCMLFVGGDMQID